MWVLVIGIGVLSVVNFIGKSEEDSGKVVYADLTEVFNQFEMKKELQQKLESEIGQKKQLLDSVMFKLSLAKSKAEDPAATEEVKWEYQQMQNYFFQEKRAFDDYSMAQTQNYDAQILKQMTQYIEDYGKEQNYKLILGKNESGNVLFGNEPSDITNDLVEAINKNYQGKE